MCWDKSGIVATGNWGDVGSMDMQETIQLLQDLLKTDVRAIHYKSTPMSWSGQLRYAGIINEPGALFLEVICAKDARRAILKNAMKHHRDEFNALRISLSKEGPMDIAGWTQWAAGFVAHEEFDIPAMFSHIVQDGSGCINCFDDLVHAANVMFVNCTPQPMNAQVSALSTPLAICPGERHVLTLDGCCFDEAYGVRVHVQELLDRSQPSQPAVLVSGWMTVADRQGNELMQRFVEDAHNDDAADDDGAEEDAEEEAAEEDTLVDDGDPSSAGPIQMTPGNGQCGKTVGVGAASTKQSRPISVAVKLGAEADNRDTEVAAPSLPSSTCRLALPKYISSRTKWGRTVYWVRSVRSQKGDTTRLQVRGIFDTADAAVDAAMTQWNCPRSVFYPTSRNPMPWTYTIRQSDKWGVRHRKGFPKVKGTFATSQLAHSAAMAEWAEELARHQNERLTNRTKTKRVTKPPGASLSCTTASTVQAIRNSSITPIKQPRKRQAASQEPSNLTEANTPDCPNLKRTCRSQHLASDGDTK